MGIRLFVNSRAPNCYSKALWGSIRKIPETPLLFTAATALVVSGDGLGLPEVVISPEVGVEHAASDQVCQGCDPSSGVLIERQPADSALVDGRMLSGFEDRNKLITCDEVRFASQDDTRTQLTFRFIAAAYAARWASPATALRILGPVPAGTHHHRQHARPATAPRPTSWSPT